MTREGPYVRNVDHNREFNGGVCLGVCQIRFFAPEDYRHNGKGWYVVKYDSEALIYLGDFSEQDANQLSAEFGIKIWNPREFRAHSGDAFYEGKAWEGLKNWVKSHPRLAKVHALQTHYYLPNWYERALEMDLSLRSPSRTPIHEI